MTVLLMLECLNWNNRPLKTSQFKLQYPDGWDNLEPALPRRAGVEEQHRTDLPLQSYVAVAEDHHIRSGLPIGFHRRVVRAFWDLHLVGQEKVPTIQLYGYLLGKKRLGARPVVVAPHRGNRGDPGQLCDDSGVAYIPGMQYVLDTRKQLGHLGVKLPVGVGNASYQQPATPLGMDSLPDSHAFS